MLIVIKDLTVTQWSSMAQNNTMHLAFDTQMLI